MKRANGTGSIVKLSGTRRRPYAVKVSGRNSYGHVIRKILSTHEKAAEAQAEGAFQGTDGPDRCA